MAVETLKSVDKIEKNIAMMNSSQLQDFEKIATRNITCREYGWDYMLVFKEGSMKDAWREAMGLIRLMPRHCGGRNQEYGGLMILNMLMVITADVLRDFTL